MNSYDAYFEALREAFNRHDPACIADCGFPGPEYDHPECELIADELPRCRDVATLKQVLHAMFVRLYDEQVAGLPEDYADLASDLMEIRTRFFGKTREAPP